MLVIVQLPYHLLQRLIVEMVSCALWNHCHSLSRLGPIAPLAQLLSTLLRIHLIYRSTFFKRFKFEFQFESKYFSNIFKHMTISTFFMLKQDPRLSHNLITRQFFIFVYISIHSKRLQCIQFSFIQPFLQQPKNFCFQNNLYTLNIMYFIALMNIKVSITTRNWSCS